MKAAVICEYGGPSVDYPDPVVGEGEVLIEVAGASVNPVDTFQRAGQRKDWMPVPLPGVIGWDISGIVVKLGPGAQGFSEGDRVLAWAFHTYAEFCVVKAQLLARVPESLDLAEAAALPLVSMTGTQLILEGAGVKPGQTVLVSGAMGGAGRAAVFAAKQQGGIVIAGVLQRQLDEAKNLRADNLTAVDDDTALNKLPAVDVVTLTTLAGRLRVD